LSYLHRLFFESISKILGIEDMPIKVLNVEKL
jgi:hypothetical protein